MAGYWLKVYTEILDDPKYGRLSDQARLGMFELMLVAKMQDQDGYVPNIEDLSWITRREDGWWQPVIEELKAIQFVINENGSMKIRKFEERQAAIPDNERQRQRRKKIHKNEFVTTTNEPSVTDVSRNVTDVSQKVMEKEKNREDKNREDINLNQDIVVNVVEKNNKNNNIDPAILKFAELACIDLEKKPLTTAESATWQAVLDDLRASGVTEPIMRQAIVELTEKNFRISSPMSIAKTCELILAEQKRKDKGTRTRDTEGRYADYVNR